MYYIFLTSFSHQFHGIQLFLVATILSHRYNSRTGSGETKVESHVSSGTQPNQAALFLNTAHIQPDTNVSEATLASAHCARPATGVPGARWDKDIPTGQALPNPDDGRPIVRCPTDLPVAAGYDRAWARTQSLWWHSAFNHCATREASKCIST
jgi:hypothetical protein